MKKYLFFFLTLPFLQFQINAQTVGLFQNDSLSINGYTLFSNNKTTYLIDNCGFVVNTWESDFRPGLSVYLLENGNLLRTGFVGSNVFQSGGQGGHLELFDWDGELLWSYSYADENVHQHHDIEPLPNGNILILGWELRSEEAVEQAGRTNPSMLWPEHIVEIEPLGTDNANFVWEWHLWDHLIQDVDSSKDNFGIIGDHPELLNINFFGEAGGPLGAADWIHANAINYNPELDQIAISSRNLNEIWIIDHSTTTAEAASHSGGNSEKGGDFLYRWGNPIAYNQGNEINQKLFGQHDVRWIPEGHPNAGSLMVFNNGKYQNGESGVDIWTPPLDANGNYLIDENEPFGPTELLWTYEAEGFGSGRVSGAHSLSNGNILICEGQEGRFIEVLPDAETIVWEYINPAATGNFVFEQGQTPNGNQTFRTTRYRDDYPAFEGKDLTPGLPIELNPLVSNCIIYENIVSISEQKTLEGVTVLNNLFDTEIIIENETNEPISLEVLNIAGQKILKQNLATETTRLSTTNFEKGFYFVRFTTLNFDKSFVQKIIKN